MPTDDLQEQGLVKVSFVPTKDNLADVGTKNASGDVLEKLRPALMMNKAEMNQMSNQD